MKLITGTIAVFVFVCCISSCASIPASTATLSQEIIAEAGSMHRLNVALVNQIFDERQEKVNTFINNQYIPAFVENFKSKVPAGTNYEAELGNILKSVMPVISRKKDSLNGLIDTQRKSVLSSLNDSYASYQKASTTLQTLLNSVIDLRKTEQNALTQIQGLTKSSIDISKIENQLDSLLIKTGNGFQKMMEIDSIIKK